MQAVVDSELSAIDFFLSQRCESPSSLDDPGLKQRHEMLKFARFRACFSDDNSSEMEMVWMRDLAVFQSSGAVMAEEDLVVEDALEESDDACETIPLAISASSVPVRPWMTTEVALRVDNFLAEEDELEGDLFAYLPSSLAPPPAPTQSFPFLEASFGEETVRIPGQGQDELEEEEEVMEGPGWEDEAIGEGEAKGLEDSGWVQLIAQLRPSTLTSSAISSEVRPFDQD